MTENASQSPSSAASPPPVEAPEDGVEAVTRAVLTASRLLVAVSARSLAEVEEAVTLPQFRMLVVLTTRGPAKLVDLAERLGVNPSTAMRMVDRLNAAGLTSRRTNPRNRRETELRATAQGMKIVHDVTARRRTEVSAIVSRIAPAQRLALVDALTAFSAAGGEPALPDPSAAPLGWPD